LSRAIRFLQPQHPTLIYDSSRRFSGRKEFPTRR
ncbi:unnamed protein product, partial [Heterotrigona itama]